MQKEEVLKEVMKKSELTAKNIYDYKKLHFNDPHLLACEIMEEKETLVFSYYIKYLKAFAEIRREHKITQLGILIGVTKLAKLAESYSFQLNPENLYYDVNGQLMVKQRDIYEAGKEFQEADFTAQYKALVGYTLQKKYNYEDYFQGGMQLLNKSEILKPFFEAADVEEIKKLLNEAYEQEDNLNKFTRIQVGKSKYRNLRAILICFTVLLLAAGSISGYQYIKVIPEKEALLTANNAYLESNYIMVIDALRAFPADSLPLHQKYLLAVSYVKSENLVASQKDNILSTMTLHGDESMMNYWIHLGRLDAVEAQNIAMQQSNDELLLYAYLKEKHLVETDTLISGEEKMQRLGSLDSKIDTLSEKYTSEEE